MPKLTTLQLELTGASGKKYRFHVYPFGEECPNESGIYAFTRAFKKPDGLNYHEVIYIGMAQSFQKRFYAHHKEKEILSTGANCICLMQVPVESERIAI